MVQAVSSLATDRHSWLPTNATVYQEPEYRAARVLSGLGLRGRANAESVRNVQYD